MNRPCTYSVNVYVDTATDVHIEGNRIFNSSPTYDRTYENGHRRPATGISIANEGYGGNIPIPAGTETNDIRIYNNYIVNAGRGISFWHDSTNERGTNTYQMVKIEHNVIRSTTDAAIDFAPVPPNFLEPKGNFMRNNIISKARSGETLQIADISGWTITFNNWPGGVPSQITDPSNRAGNPGFVAPNSTWPARRPAHQRFTKRRCWHQRKLSNKGLLGPATVKHAALHWPS